VSYFPETIQAALGGRVVKMSCLVLLDFVTEPARLWTGSGTITSGGEQWRGLGNLASITGLETALNGQAPQTSFTLSGVNSAIVSIARDEFETEAKDRLAKVLLQFHNEADDLPLELYDEPYAIWAGRMQNASFQLDGPTKRTITINAESLFAMRSRPAFSQYTDSDQQARFPGDLGFGFVSSLLNKVVTWPDF